MRATYSIGAFNERKNNTSHYPQFFHLKTFSFDKKGAFSSVVRLKEAPFSFIP